MSERSKQVTKVAGIVLLVAGGGVGFVHYLLEWSYAMRFVTLGIAAVLLLAGMALLQWSRRT